METFDERAEGIVIRDDGEERAVELAKHVPHENVGDAVMFPGGKDDDAFGRELRETNCGVGAESGLQFGKEARFLEVAFDFGAHEEAIRAGIDEFLVADDV